MNKIIYSASVLALSFSSLIFTNASQASVTLSSPDAFGPATSQPGSGLSGKFRCIQPSTDLNAALSASDCNPAESWSAVVNKLNFIDGINPDPLDTFVTTGSIATSGSPGAGVITVGPVSGSFLSSSENFTAVFTGYINIAAAGTYVFKLGHDDGARLIIGDKNIIEFPGITDFRQDSETVIFADPGLYPITIQLHENTGEANLVLSYIPPGGTQQIVPPEVLHPIAPNTGLPGLPDHPSAPGARKVLGAELSSLSQNPSFDSSERTGIALVESSLSLIAARTHIDPVTCDEKWYKLSVDATGGTEGTAIISDSDGDVTTLDAALTEASLGALVDVQAASGSSLFGAKIKNYKGDHQWSRKNNIFLDHATWDFKHPQSGRIIPYDEHSIKDYYKRVQVDLTNDPAVAPGPTNESWEFDHGIEVITKKNKPVAKWGELSWYRQEDGGDGVLKVVKQLVSRNSCRISFEATGFFPFQFVGKVHVSKVASAEHVPSL